MNEPQETRASREAQTPPLIVLTAAPADEGDCHALLRRMRRLTHDNGLSVLLLCDLPDANAPRLPQDRPLLRLLQSGVMSMEQHAPGRYMLLVRSRIYDDAQRAFLGSSRMDAPGVTAAQLLTCGSADTRFDAATVSPASLKGRFGSALLLHAHAVCTPDTPARMTDALRQSGAACLSGRVLLPERDGAPLLDRLLRTGFCLSPLRAARTFRLMRAGETDPADSPALLLGPDALRALAGGALPAACPVAEDCCFLLERSPSPEDLFVFFRLRCSAALAPACADPARRLDALLPLLRLILLLISAAGGLPLLAAAAVLLPEIGAFAHPILMPGALVRLSLLPACAFLALDALLRSLLARSPLLRIELPRSLDGGRLCVFCAALLAAAALRGHRALAAMTAVSLLFAAAPLLLRALASPASERIPLSPVEQAQMRTLAQSAFLRISDDDSPSPRQMLCDCAGCMLGLLEADEAARRIERRLTRMAAGPLSPADAACVLTAAQFLRERMGDCDASLRILPAQLEAGILRRRIRPDASPLSRLMQRACGGGEQPPSDAQPMDCDPLEALFLPPLRGHVRQKAARLLEPLMLPHTFLLPSRMDAEPPDGRAAEHALVLTEAVYGRPFLALFLRSPAAGPYAPLLFDI